MMRRVYRLWLWTLCLWLGPTLALAQGSECSAQIQQALDAASAACENTGRNQACYGNIDLRAEPQPESSFTFEKVGDVVDVAAVRSLIVSPLDAATGKWGVALLKLQANLPDTLPGQNVTFLLFGDVELTNAVDANDPTLRPMQAFYLRTAVGQTTCVEAPQSGLLVQTPKGVGAVSFSVNGVDISMGSTVFFQAEAGKQMTVSTLEGAAYASAENETQVIVPGTWISIPLGAANPADEGPPPAAAAPLDDQIAPPAPPGLMVSGPPGLPESYEGDRFAAIENLPLALLEREIEVAAPLTEAEVEVIRERIEEGAPLCDEAPFPPCDEFPNLPDTGDCVFPPGPNDPPLPENETRPFCPPVEGEGVNLPPDQRDCVFPPGPNDPPLPENETRPFCPPVEGEGVNLPPDQRDCVFPPGSNDPPLPENETRPFCPQAISVPADPALPVTPPPPAENILPPPPPPGNLPPPPAPPGG